VQGILDTGRHPLLSWPEVTGVLPALRTLYAAEPDGLFWFAGESAHPALAEAVRTLVHVDTHGLVPEDYDARRMAEKSEAVFEQEAPLDTPWPIIERMRKETLPGTETAVYYFTTGSKNQDPRSAFLDGETSFMVAGPWALVGYTDFMLLMAATT